MALLSRKVAKIDPARCLKCRVCVRSCPTKALDPPKVKISLCTGCGTCIYACPQGAIRIVTKYSVLPLVLLLVAAVLLALSLALPALHPAEAANVTAINFAEEIPQRVFTPANATMPTGEEAAGAGSGFG